MNALQQQIMTARERADHYISTTKDSVNAAYRHKFHLMPPIGWMNDPNGFIFFKGSYHMFYQFYPYDSKWGPMHWGHAVSKDLIRWEDLPVALAPGESYDKNGIFSGTALVKDDALWLYYTGVVDNNLDRMYGADLLLIQDQKNATGEPAPSRQVQCLATSSDGIIFEKYCNNPVLGENLIPEHSRLEDFRDPKVWEKDGKYYLAAGSKRKDHIGQILFYVSGDGLNWKYLNRLTLDRDFGTVWECPDFFELNGKHILLFSPQEKPRRGVNYENIHASVALFGCFDYTTGEFMIDHEQELDGGFDFYAPQTTQGPDGSRIMMAWMNMWERSYVLHDKEHGWNGSMTLPRQLFIKDEHLYQWPIKAFESYRKAGVSYERLMIQSKTRSEDVEAEKLKNIERQLSGNVLDMEICFELVQGTYFEMVLFAHLGEGIRLKFDALENICSMNRMQTSNPTLSLSARNDFVRSQKLNCSGIVHARIVLDVSSVEVFLEGGRYTMTGLFFPEPGSDGIELNTDGKVLVHTVTKYSLDI